MTIEAYIGEAVQIAFTHLGCDGLPETGQLDGDFSKSVYLGSVDAGLTPEVAETTELGQYYFEFVPNAPGLHAVRAVHDATGHVYPCLVDVSVRAEVHVMPVLKTNGSLKARVWLTRNGRQHVAVTSCQLDVYDASGANVYSESSSSANVRGVFGTEATISLTDNEPYDIVARVTDSSGDVYTNHAFASLAS